MDLVLTHLPRGVYDEIARELLSILDAGLRRR